MSDDANVEWQNTIAMEEVWDANGYTPLLLR